MTISPIVLEPIEGDSTEVAEWLVVKIVQKRWSPFPATCEDAQQQRDAYKLNDPDGNYELVHASVYQ
jgi:hypothetical protein